MGKLGSAFDEDWTHGRAFPCWGLAKAVLDKFRIP